MTLRYTRLVRGLQLAGLLAVLFCLLWPEWASAYQVEIALPLILLLGIPHGATDHILFQHIHLSGKRNGSKMKYFYGFYLTLMALYGMIWWFWPTLGLLSFLGFSAYHFGQSNWNYVNWSNPGVAATVYLIWGAFALLTPILWHWDTAAPIIAQITGSDWGGWSVNWNTRVPYGLIGLNVGLTIWLWAKGKLTAKAMGFEFLNLMVLFLVFTQTPLLIGFALYFAGWHSMTSIMDQIAFIREKRPQYALLNYVRDSMPYTLLALVGMGVLAILWWQLNFELNVGLVFVFIALVTLPHMLLIEGLYEKWEVGAMRAHITQNKNGK